MNHPYIHVLTWPWKRSLWLNNRENREVAAVNHITLHTTRYISVYVGWLTFDADDFGAYCYMVQIDLYMYMEHVAKLILYYYNFFSISLCSTEPTMKDLISEVAVRIPSSWFEFGIYLNIPHESLKIIEINRRHDNLQCFADVFDKWMKSLSRAPISWATVITVLKSMDEGKLVADLMEKYGAGTNTPGSSTSSSIGDDHDTGGANPSQHKPHTGE